MLDRQPFVPETLIAPGRGCPRNTGSCVPWNHGCCAATAAAKRTWSPQLADQRKGSPLLCDFRRLGAPNIRPSAMRSSCVASRQRRRRRAGWGSREPWFTGSLVPMNMAEVYVSPGRCDRNGGPPLRFGAAPPVEAENDGQFTLSCVPWNQGTQVQRITCSCDRKATGRAGDLVSSSLSASCDPANVSSWEHRILGIKEHRFNGS